MTDTGSLQPGARICAYLRDSGGDNQDLSVPQQENVLRRWAAENGYIITSWYRDEARPGSSDVGRQGFQDMINHLRSPHCSEDGVVIWKMSRFAREFDDSQFYKADLRRRGYIIISLNDNIPDGPEGRLIEAAIDWMNDRFLADLSSDVKRGLTDLVAIHGAVPGTPPRGFKREPIHLGKRRDGQDHIVHRWVPDPDWIPRIRQAVEMLIAGQSLAEITAATHLFRSNNSYKTWFANPLLKGTLIYGGTIYPNYCEPVIDADTWNQVQAVMAARANRKHMTGDNPGHPRRVSSTYLLSGLIYCAKCQSPLSGMRRNNQETYACSNAKRTKTCSMKPVPKKLLEQKILETLTGFILQPETQLALSSNTNRSETERLDELDGQLRENKNRLAAVRRRIANITDTLAEAGKSRSLLEKLISLELEESDLIAAHNKLEQQARTQPRRLTPDELTAAAAELHHELLHQPPETVKRLLRGLIQKITVDRNDRQISGEITYLHPPDAPHRNKPPPNPKQSYNSSSRGGTSSKYCFSFPFTILIRPYTRRP